MTNTPEGSDSDLSILILFLAGLLIYFYWWLYNDYRRKQQLLLDSNIIDFFQSKDWIVKEEFNGWEHSVKILGIHNNFPFQIDLPHDKGLVFNKYYFSISAFVEFSNEKILKEEGKRMRNRLRSQNIDLSGELAMCSSEIPLTNDLGLKNEIKMVLDSLTGTLKENGLSPLTIKTAPNIS
ncbi:hypothetical protein [Desertivirga brevis]|uniref:hypothetical protein n=1 Tax=Desertivirga brevis TaxID=2810310 RepID=UPI001A97B830|nr:hypothetical protein [Pedobacter sp. SYSU D00873]